jgi:hypothetical protein
MLYGGCRLNSKCEGWNDDIWVFEHFTRDQFDFTFLEQPVLGHLSTRPKCLKRGFTTQHDCGIGKTVDEHWHHVHQGGTFQANAKQGWEAIPEKVDESMKEMAEDVKMDKKGKDKEGERTEDDTDDEMKNLSLE